MHKIAISILFGTSLLASGCTVHHYHHTVPAKSGKHGRAGHEGCPCSRDLPEGHPPVGHGMKGHGMDPHHGMKGHGMEGMGMDPHHGMKGHGMEGHGMDPHHGMEGHSPEVLESPFDEHANNGQHHAMPPMPAPVESFHDGFAAVWHLETDEERKASACAKVDSLKKLSAGVKAHTLEGEFAAEFASAAVALESKVAAVAVACKRKKADVQAALKDTHDAFHAILATLQKSAAN